MIQIAPSILSCDFARLGEEIRAVETAGADVHHVDVMDGHFVPNISIGIPVVRRLKTVTSLPLDCHLMITNPGDFIAPFATAGADWISVHAEVCDLSIVLPQIRTHGCKAGAALKPSTPIDALLPHLQSIDYILVMSVEPGFSGQAFIPECLEKIRTLRAALDRRECTIPIQVDGGVTTGNASTIINAGASILVAGNAIYKTPDYAAAIRALRGN